MLDPTHRPLPVQLQVDHPAWVKELAFTCWLAADRNASRALTLLHERWPPDEPYRAVPYRTLAGWVQRLDWDAKADDAIAHAFPGLTMRHAARLVHLSGLALSTLEEVISGDGFVRDGEGNVLYDEQGNALLIDPRHQRNRLDGAVKALELAGVGTAGSRLREAPVVRAVAAEQPDLSQMTMQELGRYARSLAVQSKTDDPRRKR